MLKAKFDYAICFELSPNQLRTS